MATKIDSIEFTFRGETPFLTFRFDGGTVGVPASEFTAEPSRGEASKLPTAGPDSVPKPVSVTAAAPKKDSK